MLGMIVEIIFYLININKSSSRRLLFILNISRSLNILIVIENIVNHKSKLCDDIWGKRWGFGIRDLKKLAIGLPKSGLKA